MSLSFFYKGDCKLIENVFSRKGDEVINKTEDSQVLVSP